jgi:uncharacterized alpha-E superfamily protein
VPSGQRATGPTAFVLAGGGSLGAVQVGMLRALTAAGVVPDPLKWSVLLRALSAFEVYRRVYRDVVTPLKVAQLLIMRNDMPRSLLRCCNEVYQNLKSVANEHSAETVRRAGEVHAMLHFSRMEAIAAGGLPRFFEDFLSRMRDLGERMDKKHRVYLALLVLVAVLGLTMVIGAPGNGRADLRRRDRRAL